MCVCKGQQTLACRHVALLGIPVRISQIGKTNASVVARPPLLLEAPLARGPDWLALRIQSIKGTVGRATLCVEPALTFTCQGENDHLLPPELRGKPVPRLPQQLHNRHAFSSELRKSVIANVRRPVAIRKAH
eukprot:1083582-Amphidinium_carterae.1